MCSSVPADVLWDTFVSLNIKNVTCHVAVMSPEYLIYLVGLKLVNSVGCLGVFKNDKGCFLGQVQPIAQYQIAYSI